MDSVTEDKTEIVVGGTRVVIYTPRTLRPTSIAIGGERAMSDFTVPVVRIGKITKHPNADTLSVVTVEGCPVIIRTQDFNEGDPAIYLPIESVIPEGKEWVKKHCSHLKFSAHGTHRLKAVKLRGVFSMGMLVPYVARYEAADERQPGASRWLQASEMYIGEDVAEELGVIKYEEPEDRVTTRPAPAPTTVLGRLAAWLRRLFQGDKKPKPRLMPVYDVSQYRKSKDVLKPDEDVVVTEKVHGTNFAACFTKGRLQVSSHRVLRKIEDDSVYWRVARMYDLDARLREKPDVAFYGEIYGSGVQDMEYDVAKGEIRLVIFDAMDLKTRTFLNEQKMRDICGNLGLPTVPVLYRGPYRPEVVEPLCEGQSRLAAHFREGIVIRPATERRDPRIGRVILKLVSETYLLRKGATEAH